MKNIYKLTVILGFVLAFSACENFDQEFDDFDYTSVYFPFQYPVRTLVLGDYVFDNSNDKEGRFTVFARMGGVYENKENVTVQYRVAEDIVQNIEFEDGNEIKVLPSIYYTLKGEGGIENQTTILPGNLTGGIEIQLTDAFFQDPLAIANNYVLPLVITETSADSLLIGSSAFDNPNRFNNAEWDPSPKDFTLFGVKYVNPFHGNYLHSGEAITYDAAGQQIDIILSNAEFVEQRELWSLNTHDLTSINTTNAVKQSAGSPGDYTMNMEVSDDGDIQISTGEGSSFDVNGIGKYVKDGGAWGGEARDAMYLDYEILVGTNTVKVIDTLLFRDKGVALEEFKPVITP